MNIFVKLKRFFAKKNLLMQIYLVKDKYNALRDIESSIQFVSKKDFDYVRACEYFEFCTSSFRLEILDICKSNIYLKNFLFEVDNSLFISYCAEVNIPLEEVTALREIKEYFIKKYFIKDEQTDK